MSIYADYNATTPVAPEVLDAMLPFFTEQAANPSASHRGASEPKKAVARARKQVADLLGAQASEIIFTAGGTESDNIALGGALPFMADADRAQTILVGAIEHPAILEQIPHLKERGYTVKKIGVTSDGSINRESYAKLLEEHDVALVSLMWANNETGVIYPIDELAAMAHEAGALFHSDAVQAVGKIPVDVASVDLLSISSHKLCGPKGVGALYVKQGLRLNPISWGGGQEGGLRPGTINVPGIVGMGAACELAASHLDEYASRITPLRDEIEAAVVSAFPSATVNGADQPRLPNTSNIAFKNVESEMVLMALDKAGIYASAGSACSAADHQASHVLSAMRLPKQWLYGVLRLSISHLTSADEASDIAEAVVRSVKRFQ